MGETMSRRSTPAFCLKVGAHGAEVLRVSGLSSGVEGMSRLFDFRVEFFSTNGESLAAADLVGKDALVTLTVRDGSSRFVHGQVRRWSHWASRQAGSATGPR